MAPSEVSTPSGRCGLRACGHLPTACLRRWGAADLVTGSPRPGSLLARCQLREPQYPRCQSSRAELHGHADAAPVGAPTPPEQRRLRARGRPPTERRQDQSSEDTTATGGCTRAQPNLKLVKLLVVLDRGLQAVRRLANLWPFACKDP